MTVVAVLGQIARDIALGVTDVPAAGASTAVTEGKEMLGDKGANQAVALAQLGYRPALIGVVGDDHAGARLLEQARADGIDVSGVARRLGCATALIVDVADPAAWRYPEDVPASSLLSLRDVASAAQVMRSASGALVQAQQPLCAAAGVGRSTGATVVLGGAVPPGRERLLRFVDVVRMDENEAQISTGERVGDADEARTPSDDSSTRGNRAQPVWRYAIADMPGARTDRGAARQGWPADRAPGRVDPPGSR